MKTGINEHGRTKGQNSKFGLGVINVTFEEQVTEIRALQMRVKYIRG